MLTLRDHSQRFRVRRAVKVTIASVLCALIGFFFHLSMGYLSPLIVIFALVLFPGKTVEAGVPCCLAILVAGSIALAICMVLAEAQFAFLLCMLGWLFVWMAFLTRVPLGLALGGILIAMVLFTVTLGTGQPEDLITGFWSQVFIGIAVAIVVDHLIWPPGAKISLYETLATVFEDFASKIETLGEEIRTRRADGTFSDVDLSQIAHLSNTLGHAVVGSSQAEFQLKFRCWLVWDRLQALRRNALTSGFLSFGDTQISDLEDIVSDLAWHFSELADAARHQRRAARLATPTQQKVEALVDTLRGRVVEPSGMSDQSPTATALIRLLRHSLEDHEKLADAYNALLDQRTAITLRDAASSDSPTGRFSWPTADDYKSSAKIVLITFILFVGVVYLNFPGSSLVAFYGVVFGLTVNLGQLYMKGETGVLGVVAALAYGMLGILIVVQAPHLPVLLGVFALGVFVAVYVAAGEQTEIFMGLQAALLMPYAFLIYEGPEWTIENAATRASALAISAVVAFIVQRLIWPVDPLAKFRVVIVEAVEDIALTWEQVWKRGRSVEDGSEGAERDSSEALILAFGECATWLQDSRYLIGSEGVVAKRYSRILRPLEEVFAELRVIARLMQQSAGSSLVEAATQHLAEPIDTIARGFGAVASHYRDLKNADALNDLNDMLAELGQIDHMLARHRDVAASTAAAPLKDRHDLTMLVQTMRELAQSLSSVVSAALDISEYDRPSLGRSRAWMTFQARPVNPEAR